MHVLAGYVLNVGREVFQQEMAPLVPLSGVVKCLKYRS